MDISSSPFDANDHTTFLLPSESRRHCKHLMSHSINAWNLVWLALINYSFPGEQCRVWRTAAPIASYPCGAACFMHIGTITACLQADHVPTSPFLQYWNSNFLVREKLVPLFWNCKKIILFDGKLLERLDNRTEVQCRGTCFHPSKLTSEFVAPAEFCKLLHWSHLVRTLYWAYGSSLCLHMNWFQYLVSTDPFYSSLR